MSVPSPRFRQTDDGLGLVVRGQRGFEAVDHPHRGVARTVPHFGVTETAHDAVAQFVVAETIDPNFRYADLLDDHDNNPRCLLPLDYRRASVYRQLSLCDGRATSLTPDTFAPAHSGVSV